MPSDGTTRWSKAFLAASSLRVWRQCSSGLVPLAQTVELLMSISPPVGRRLVGLSEERRPPEVAGNLAVMHGKDTCDGPHGTN